MDSAFLHEEFRGSAWNLEGQFNLLRDRFSPDILQDPVFKSLGVEDGNGRLDFKDVRTTAEVLRAVQCIRELALKGMSFTTHSEEQLAVANLELDKLDPSSESPGQIYLSVPLHNPESQSRLIELLPGGDGEAIRLNLIVMEDLGSRPFEALSYVWGSRDAGVTISVNGKPFLVSANLSQALSCLRDAESSRLLWVDAICINQADTVEKSLQVSLMGAIYRSAHDGLIFLGEERDDSDMVMEYLDFEDAEQIEEVSPAAVTMGKESRETHDEENFHAVQARILAYGFDAARFFRAVESFFRRPWWTRMWVLQEFYLARNDPRWVCGRRCITTAKMADKLLQLFNYHNGQSLPIHGNTVLSAGTQISGREWIEISRIRTNILSLFDRGRRRHIQGQTLLASFYNTRHRQTTDPRDRIFAVREMLSDIGRLSFPPNYDVPVNELFAKLSIYVLLHEKNGHFLYDFFELVALRDTASWVLDFARPFCPQGQLQLTAYFNQDKVSWANNTDQTSIYGGILRVPGIQVDALDKVVCFDETSDAEVLEAFWRFEGLLQKSRPVEPLSKAAHPFVPSNYLFPFTDIREVLAGAKALNFVPTTPALPGYQLAALLSLKYFTQFALGVLKPPACENCEKATQELMKIEPISRLYEFVSLTCMNSEGPESFYGGACFDLSNLKAQIMSVQLSDGAFQRMPDSAGPNNNRNGRRFYSPEYSRIKEILRQARTQGELEWQKGIACSIADIFNSVSCEMFAGENRLPSLSEAYAEFDREVGATHASKLLAFRTLAKNCSCTGGRRDGHQRLLGSMMGMNDQLKSFVNEVKINSYEKSKGWESLIGFASAIKRQLSGMFVTRSGFFGMIFQRRSKIKEGDKLVLLDGMPAPKVLEETEYSGRWRMKAVADVIGVRYADISRLVELGVWQRREFEIE